ncbi:antirestriction protein ArdA [Nocardia sp. CA-107356]|uniref:antirestriction protein ArdA n=1 Tax=Nocardia sp. CA-107356 TaxID=3239972 RepID=UPI003D8EAA78
MNEQFPQHNSGDEPPDEHFESGDTEASREQQQWPNPRIYVTKGLPLRAELTEGTWLDMARDPEAIYAEMYAVLGPEETETYDADRLYIWDYRGFGSFTITTGAIGLEGVDSIGLLAQVARGIAEHGPAYAVWAEAHEDDPHLFDHFATAYQGHHDNIAAYVRQIFKPLGIEELLARAASEGLQNYVGLDYDGIGREMVAEGDVIAFPADQGGVWIFTEQA